MKRYRMRPNIGHSGSSVMAQAFDDEYASNAGTLSPDGWVRYEDAMAEIVDLKQQLATCCQLASMSAKQAEAFAAALNEATGVVAGHWENERAR